MLHGGGYRMCISSYDPTSDLDRLKDGHTIANDSPLSQSVHTAIA